MSEDKESSILLKASQDAEKIIFRVLQEYSFEGEGNFASQFASDSIRDNLLNQRSPAMKDFLKRVTGKYCSPEGHVLDTGCGHGGDSALIISMGHKVVSCDILEDIVKVAKANKNYLVEEKGDKRFESWEIFRGDVSSLKQTVEANPHLPQQYDCIICVGGILQALRDEKVEKALDNFYSLLKPGGALVVDHRNFRSAIERGYFNSKGKNPNNYALFLSDSETGAFEVKPYVVYGPAPERKPIVVVNQFIRNNGSIAYTAYNPISRTKVIPMIKAAFGEECNITVLHDLLSEDELLEIDTCFLFYVIDKPLK